MKIKLDNLREIEIDIGGKFKCPTCKGPTFAENHPCAGCLGLWLNVIKFLQEFYEQNKSHALLDKPKEKAYNEENE